MRLQEIKKVLTSNIDNLQYKSTSIHSGNNYEISGYLKVIRSINEIASLGFLDDEINKLKQFTNIYYDRSLDDKIQVNVTTFNGFNSIVKDIVEKCNTVKKAMNLAIPSETEYSVSIKLPSFNELDCLPSFFSSLDKSLNQALVNEHIKGTVSIEAFDSGSLWVVLSVGSATALHFLGKITDAAAKISKVIFDIKREKIAIEQYSANKDFLEEYNKIQVERLKVYVQEEAKVIADSENIKDPDYLVRLQFAIKEIGTLLTQGTQIHPNTIAAPEETNFFPDFTTLAPQIQSQIKLLDELNKSNQSDKKVDSSIVETETEI